ncbi:hypothetical protein [Glaciimonas sp. PAMC28666]|nr:hypothetical protein [Glaciimonas sp. PAMC28666]QRX80953.1 hypothetical protein JQN73_12075 [Glaciimonas sp. PAMC28666]
MKISTFVAPSDRPVADENASAERLTWHGKSDTAFERLESLHGKPA